MRVSFILLLYPVLISSAGAADYREPLSASYVLRDFRFTSGEVLPELRIHYRTVGQPRRDQTGVVRNAVLILHGTTGSGANFLRGEFAGELFGSGQPLDAGRFYIVLPDGIGHGASSKPSDGLKARFPRYGYRDMVEAQYRLLADGLKVNHLRLVMGTSMGGMHTWLWGQQHPEFMDALLPLASLPTQISGRNRAWRRLVSDAIRNDPACERGDYRAQPPSLRTAALVVYLMSNNPVERQKEAPTREAADKTLDEYIARTTRTMDANDVLYAIESSADYDPGPGLEQIRVPLLAINFEDDLINPPELRVLEKEIGRVKRGKAIVIPRSERTRGHGTHTLAAVWKEHLIRLLQESEHQKTNDGRVAPSQKSHQPHVTPVVGHADAPMTTGSSRTIIVSLPPRAELHQLLRRASSEAVALAKTKPISSSWSLTTIATAQAKAGDLDGARMTFAFAATEAERGFGGEANPWNLWRVGHFQAECGLKQQARISLHRAVRALPGVVGDYQKDSRTVDTFSVIVQELGGIGAREDARKTVDLLLGFSKKFFESSKIGNARDWAAPKIAAALAAVGDFEAAFRWSDGLQNGGNVLGEIAVAASKSLGRDAARRFVLETAEQLGRMRSADQTYFGLSELAEAQARLGDVEAAKRSAKSIGAGPSRASYDMTDGQPYALVRIAGVQRQSGDTAGAKETLRDAFRSVSEHPLMRGRDGWYSQIASGQIANGDIDGALRSVEAMDGKRSDSLAFIALAQSAAGESIAARATIGRALADAGLSVKAPPAPNPELMKLPGVSQNMPASARMQLAKIQAMAGDSAGALTTLRSIDDQNYQRFALERVVSARATAGDVAGALRMALDDSKTPEERRSALEGLGQGVDTRLSLKSLEPRAK